MATVYSVTKYINEWLMDKNGKTCIKQIGEPDPGKVIAYAKNIQGAIKFLNGYFDEEMDLHAFRSDHLVISKSTHYPKRQLDYDCFNDEGYVRHRVTLAIVKRETILSDCL